MSRYFVVERLAMQKIDLIDRKNSVEEELEVYAQKIKSLEDGLDAFQKDAVEDMNRQIRDKKNDIAGFVKSMEFKKQRKDSMVSSLAEKISEIDKVLESIEEISKSAPSPERQGSK